MKPEKFPQSNATLSKPAGWTDAECQDLHCWAERDLQRPRFISKWRMSWRERLQVLLTGTVWFHVYQFTHPPIFLGTEHPFPTPINQRRVPKWVKSWLTRRAIAKAVSDAVV